MSVIEILDKIVNDSTCWAEFMDKFGSEVDTIEILDEHMGNMLHTMQQISIQFGVTNNNAKHD